MNAIVENYKINYIDEGKGQVVVLIHGWGANLNCFSFLIELLKCKYRVIALDLPGFGESDGLRESFFVDDYVNIVISFLSEVLHLDASKKEKLIFVGHSYGGRIIIKLNSRTDLPFEIQKNVLIDAAGIKDKRDIKSKIKIFVFKTIKKIVKYLPFSKIKKNELETLVKNKFGSKDYLSAPKVLQDTLVKSVNEDLTSYLDNMKETLLIWGNKDTATPLYMAKIMEKRIKNSGLVVLKGGHFSYLDDINTFVSVIVSYFSLNI